MKKQLSKLDKWLIVFTVFDISLILIFGILIYFLHFHNRLEYKEYNGPEVTKLNFEGASPYMEDVILDINRRTNTNYVIRFDEELSNSIRFEPSCSSSFSFANTLSAPNEELFLKEIN